MTTKAQRIAIAEACGWKDCSIHLEWFGEVLGTPPDHWSGTCRQESPTLAEPPDYLNNLNAMHEAEKGLPAIKRPGTYERILEEVAGVDAHCATAAQRAEAFLRTINKWEDSK